MEERYYSIGQASKILGVSISTLRRWDKSGKFAPDIRTKGGHRRYSQRAIRALLGKPLALPPPERKVILYARVAKPSQKEELKEQISTLKRFAEGRGYSYDEVFSEVGSGLSYRRPLLRKLLTLALSGRIEKVIVTKKDRLVRFGFELIEEILSRCGAELVVINRSLRSERTEELGDELIRIVRQFCTKFYGKSRASCRKAERLAKEIVSVLSSNQLE
jgi:predicted site-specific integrase-resolvase